MRVVSACAVRRYSLRTGTLPKRPPRNDARAERPRSPHDGGDVRLERIDARSEFVTGATRSNRNACHSDDTGDTLTAKTEGAERFEPRCIAQFTGRVPFDRKRKIVGGNARAVVDDLDLVDAPALQRDHDARRSRVQSVLDEFLDNRNGPFDDFARGDLADRQIVEPANPPRGGNFGVMRHAADLWFVQNLSSSELVPCRYQSSAICAAISPVVTSGLNAGLRFAGSTSPKRSAASTRARTHDGFGQAGHLGDLDAERT